MLKVKAESLIFIKENNIKKIFLHSKIYAAVGIASTSHRYTVYFHVWESNEAFEI